VRKKSQSCAGKPENAEKKLLSIKIFFIKALHFSKKDDNMDSMKTAFVKIARGARMAV